MESVDVGLFGGAYRGRRVLVTGHTGFKGSWLTLWLSGLGASVSGLALDPGRDDSHWDLLGLDVEERRADIRDRAVVDSVMREFRPEIVFHLAAQSLVRRSYDDPVDTWATNVMGTVNLLEACRKAGSVRAVVSVTSDKVYRNRSWPWGYRENDVLGGHDPYSASKAACELVVESYRDALLCAEDAPWVASARAGNVIGGGDWAADRLLPDAARAVRAGQQLVVRSPAATRPWQHVLDCLAGYLLLGQHLLERRNGAAGAWNFGPSREDNVTVGELLELMRRYWPALEWTRDARPGPHEAAQLHVDSSKARSDLRWQPVWNVQTAVARSAEWYDAFQRDGSVLSRSQLGQYVQDARRAAAVWSRS